LTVPADGVLDLLVVGAGPTGIALGAAARRAGLSVLLVDRGSLVASLVGYPDEMIFFTTRDKLEIAGIPFSIPDEKPNRRQAIAYYQGVTSSYELPLALHEETLEIEPRQGGFRVLGVGREGATERTARAVAVATGYFTWPERLGVPGEDLPWVHHRYRQPWPHFGESVVVVGAGNSGAEVALDLWRHGAGVTLVHRHPGPKPTVKYWVKPDLENRIEEGSIRALFSTRVTRFEERSIVVERESGAEESIPADACYVLIGYRPATRLLEAAGVTVDRESLVPTYDPMTCETNVPGLYVAGTTQAGTETHKVFIENSRDHGVRIVEHLLARRR
jgi:bacillithiol disulfide reductase